MQNYITLITKAIENMKNHAIGGDVQAHEAYAIIKNSDIEGVLKSAMDEIKSAAITNLQHNFLDHNEKTYKGGGYKYTITSGATRYYFTDILEVKDAKFAAERTLEYKKLKATESKYKTAYIMKQNNQVMVDEETGEIVDPSMVKVVYSADSLSVKTTAYDM